MKVEDTGRYSCLATSPAGDDDKEFLVRVHGKFIIIVLGGYCNHKDILMNLSFVSIVPPNIAGESGVQDVSVLQNRQVTLECRSDAVPPPTLSWLKDGAPLKVYAVWMYSDQTALVDKLE